MQTTPATVTSCRTGELSTRVDTRTGAGGAQQAAIEVLPCPGAATPGPQFVAQPTLTIFDTAGEPLPVVVRPAPGAIGGDRPVGAPVCTVLSWTQRPGTATRVTTVVIAAKGDQPRIVVKVPLSLGAGEVLRVSAWVPSSGECLGSS